MRAHKTPNSPSGVADASVPVDVDPAWERLWLQALRTEWRSLAIVPLDATIDADRVAQALTAVANRAGTTNLRWIDARQTTLSGVPGLLDQIRRSAQGASRAVVALAPIADNPAAISIARAATRSLLVVRMGESRIAAARTTLDAIGRERVIGSLLVE
jgi:hypothetical protein